MRDTPMAESNESMPVTAHRRALILLSAIEEDGLYDGTDVPDDVWLWLLLLEESGFIEQVHLDQRVTYCITRHGVGYLAMGGKRRE